MGKRIIVYAEPLKTFTSAMPLRGMLPELLRLRPNDQFVFVTRRKSQANTVLDSFFQSLHQFSNWERHELRRSERFMHLLALLRYSEYCRVPVAGDLYLNTDIHFLGKNQHPQIALLADLSTVRRPEQSSLNRIGVRIRQFALQQMVRHADHIVAISGFSRQDLIDWAPETADRSSVIHHGIDERWFDEIRPPRTMRRPYWIWYGNISPRKNLEGLLRAYHRLFQLHRGMPDIVLIGKLSEASRSLPEQAAELGLTERIHFLPFQDLPSLIGMVGASQGLVFPSFYEGFGLPVAECMAQGVPVLCSEVTALPEIAGGQAILCDPEREESMMEGLTRLMDQRQWTPEAVQGRQEQARRFTYSQSARTFSTLIDTQLKPS